MGIPHHRLAPCRSVLLRFTLLAVTSFGLLVVAQESPSYDLVLSGGQVVDGTGNPWFHGDVAIRGDRIVAIGKLPPHSARRRIDCQGLVVTPGFIDIHSHSDDLLLEDGAAQSKIRQGVTTEILGEDTSGGPYVGRLEAHSLDVNGRTLTWRTLGEYFETLEREGISVNAASYVGLGNIWRCVMGEDFDRPQPAQMDAMKQLIADAMEEGALGLSSMLAVPPGLLTKTKDIVDLCKVVAAHGGIFSSHIRNEGTQVIAAIKEAIAVGEGAGVRVDIIHIKIADQRLWGRMDEVIALIDEARARGVDVQANVYPYTRGNNALATIVPPWAHEGGFEAMLARLRDPVQREKVKEGILEGVPGWYNHYLAVGGDWSRMLVNADLSEKNKRFEGMTMDRILKLRRSQHPDADDLDLLFDFLQEEKGVISTIYAHHEEKDMNLVLKQPWCSIGSDGAAYAVSGPLRRGKPHPRNFGTFPRALGVYVRKRGLLTLEDAVRKITSLNASKVGLVERGALRSGYFADVTVFDPARVIDRSTYLEPFQYNEGIEYVVVNGEVVLAKGEHSGKRPGRVLRPEW
jgi:N-acyl-D-amino-acid deacylase